ncbi:TonB-dependent receptor [Paraburkholderia bannensis]|uniref:TonB-dependent receptor n=1 Tax=Paraburkholderia bannensis TaxID=765414 RepID=UPI002ABE93CF|nr:TonB-dependent receptor [Paraburkholderia bannensis]
MDPHPHLYSLTAIAAAIFAATASYAQTPVSAPGSVAIERSAADQDADRPATQAAASASAAPSGGATAPAGAASSRAADGQVRLKDFTVTARRRNESSQKVPAPISTVSGATLETQRNYRLQDLQQDFASLNVAFLHPRQSSISIRGIGNNPASDDIESSVGVYLDNVYLGRPGMAVFDLLDIQQIDLLRGPQGTLFGKNATAGVLNISTHLPESRLGAYLEQSVGNNGYAQSKAHLTGPLSDTLSGSLDLEHTHSDGWVTNAYTGGKLDGSANYGARGQLLWKPNADLSARFIVDYNTVNANTGAAVAYGTPAGSTSWVSRATVLGITPITNPYLYAVDVDTTPHMNVHQGGASVEVDDKLAGGYALTSISAARFWNFQPTNDADYLPIPAITNSGASVNDHQFSQELRLASPTGGRVDWVAGAFYFYQQTNNTTFTDYGPDADVYQYLGVNRGILNNVTSISPSTVITNSAALFGQGTFHLTSRADITAGIRGTYESKTGSVVRYAPEGGIDLPASLEPIRNAAVGAYNSGPLGLHSISPSGLLNFSYKLTPQVLTYATLSHSEKSGGINMGVGSAPTLGADSLLFGAERANDAELGIKSEWFDHKLVLNGDLFWTQIHGYQATTFEPGPSGTLTSVLANAADVNSRGAEIDLRAKPLRGLTLGLNASYNAATYSQFDKAPCPLEVQYTTGKTVCNLTGQAVAGAPRWIANLSAQYDFYLGHDISQYVALGYSLRSSQFGTLDDSRYAKIPGYGLVNLATGWHLNSGAHRWDISLWVRNLFDKEYFLTTLSQGSWYSASVGDRRMFGATLRYTW